LSNAEAFYSSGFALVFVGALIIILAFFLLFFSNAKKDRKTEGGALVIVGPFPIAFGADHKSTKTVLVLSIILTILLMIVTIITYMVSR
jgi:uncharacterized protein (TIGR00304 family)